MLSRVDLVKFNTSYNQAPKTSVQTFCGVKLYNERKISEKLSLSVSKLQTKIAKIFGSIKKILYPEPTIDYRDNRFIKRVQKRLPKRFPYGEFNDQYGNFITVKQIKNKNTQVNIYYPLNEDNSKELKRSIILDSDNNILEYQTSYPWKIFRKECDGYVCRKNGDMYIKESLKDPMVFFEIFPK